MTGPRRLDPHDLAPADLFDHLHPRKATTMPFHGTIVTEHQECTADTVEAISREAIRPARTIAAALVGRIEGARELCLVPSDAMLRSAQNLAALVDMLLSDRTLPLEDATCGWSGDVEVEVTGGTRAQFDVAWTCPRCGNVTTDVRNGGE